MTTTVAVLLEGVFATTAGANYTSKDSVTSIDKLTATNESALITTVTAQLMSPDGSQVASYKKALSPGATWPFPEVVGHVLADGGSLKMICPADNSIRVRASGRQFT
jgi:hypothetical protein